MTKDYLVVLRSSSGGGDRKISLGRLNRHINGCTSFFDYYLIRVQICIFKVDLVVVVVLKKRVTKSF